MRLPDRHFLAFGLVTILSACGAGTRVDPVAAPALAGPAADYPIVIGEPYAVMGVQYTPVDTMNYDEVGYAAIEQGEGQAVSGAHHTLPLPSYVEVTSLESGRTILVRLTQRGPMDGNSIVALSQAAASQLGIVSGTPVRVRRVNPPEFERAMLRRGDTAPERMETPQSLVTVLRRNLPADGKPATLAPAAPPASASASASASIPPAVAETPTPPEPRPSAAAQSHALPPPEPVAVSARADGPATAASATPSAASGRFVVQLGAFSVESNANSLASKIDGRVERSGKLYLVRTGPYADKGAAKAALAKVVAAGYSGARIYSLQ